MSQSIYNLCRPLCDFLWGLPAVGTGQDRKPNKKFLPSGLCRRCGKGRHWTNECRTTRDGQGNPLPSGNSLRVLMPSGLMPLALMPNSVVSHHHGGNFFPEQLKNPMPIGKNHTALDDRTAIEDKRKISGETIKQIFWNLL